MAAWEKYYSNWYNNCFEEDLDSWFFSSFLFTKGGNLAHKRVNNGNVVLGTGEQVTHNSGGESDYG